MAGPITNAQDTISILEIRDRIEDLEEKEDAINNARDALEFADDDDEEISTEKLQAELDAAEEDFPTEERRELESLRNVVNSFVDFHQKGVLMRDSYFEKCAGNQELRRSSSSVDFDGETYWVLA